MACETYVDSRTNGHHERRIQFTKLQCSSFSMGTPLFIVNMRAWNVTSEFIKSQMAKTFTSQKQRTLSPVMLQLMLVLFLA